MKTYIGTRIVKAEPHVKIADYKIEDADVEIDGYSTLYQDKYDCWLPKEVFEKTYREVGKMTFSQALEALKMGIWVKRWGWGDFYLSITQNPNSVSKQNDKQLTLMLKGKVIEDLFAPTQDDIMIDDWTIACLNFQAVS